MRRLRSLERLRSADIDTLAAGVHHDGGGLFLRVEDTGSRRWLLRLTLHGRRVMRGLGPYPTISLKMARDKATDFRRGAREGRDVARTARSPTFEQAFEQHFVRVMRINEAPAIEVHLVRNLEAPGGIGEPGTAVTARSTQPRSRLTPAPTSSPR